MTYTYSVCEVSWATFSEVKRKLVEAEYFHAIHNDGKTLDMHGIALEVGRTEKKEPGHFEICREMARRNMDIRMSPMENVESVTWSEKKQGTRVVIGIAGNIVAQVGLNKFVGGLILSDAEQYFALAKELKGL